MKSATLFLTVVNSRLGQHTITQSIRAFDALKGYLKGYLTIVCDPCRPVILVCDRERARTGRQIDGHRRGMTKRERARDLLMKSYVLSILFMGGLH